ncbi:MAG: cytoplasmic protein [Chloroflexi bacterium]|nr:cytoplasmic protein [Chloroflexota bacterium]
MAAIRVLLAGESWVSSSTHFKGWDFFSSTVYDTGIAYLQAALIEAGIHFAFLPNHLAAEQFPNTPDLLSRFDVIILSDIGANTLLLHPDTWLRGQPTPNRLKLLREWVEGGGGLAMCGGYYSFAGIYGGAKYYRTPIEAILPVDIFPFDDRVEAPEGAQPQVLDAAHPILTSVPSDWPTLLGYNELTLKADARLLASVDDHPLLAVRMVEQGRTLAWASDIGPHWCPEPFATWEGYTRLWVQAVEWLAGKR